MKARVFDGVTFELNAERDGKRYHRVYRVSEREISTARLDLLCTIQRRLENELAREAGVEVGEVTVMRYARYRDPACAYAQVLAAVAA